MYVKKYIRVRVLNATVPVSVSQYTHMHTNIARQLMCTSCHCDASLLAKAELRNTLVPSLHNLQLLRCQYLYFCNSRASNLSTCPECTRNLNGRPVGLLVFGSMGPAAQRKTRTKKIFQCAAPLHIRAAGLSGDFHSSSAMNTGCACALREAGDARGGKCCPKTTPMESTRFKDYTHRRIACVVLARARLTPRFSN